MAEVNAPTLPVIAAVPPRNGSPQASQQASEQPEQPSFAQVLKSRSPSPQQTEGKPVQNTKPAKNEGKQGAEIKDAQALAEAQAKEQAGLETERLLIAGQRQEQDLKPEGEEVQLITETLNQNSLMLDSPAQDPASLAAAFAASTAILAAKPALQAKDSTLPDNEQVSEEGLTLTDSDEDASGQASRGLSEHDPSARQTTTTDLRAERFNANQTALIDSKAGREGAQQSSFSNELALAQSSPGQNAQSTQSLAQASLQNARMESNLPRHEVSTPVATRGWAEDVGQKLTWISTRDSGRAELVLNPPQMGRVEVSINLQGDQASAVFSAANPIAREALQDALPRLREVFAQAGLQLGQADVNAGNSGQAQADKQAARNPGSPRYASGDSAALEPLVSAGHASWSRSGSGMVDTFA